MKSNALKMRIRKTATIIIFTLAISSYIIIYRNSNLVKVQTQSLVKEIFSNLKGKTANMFEKKEYNLFH